jgi:hypothetical protein
MATLGLGQRAMSGRLVPFLPGDFYYVVEKTSRSPERLILVGGQALEVWGVVLDVKPPSAVEVDEQNFHALTVDADWLGQKADAQWLADLLGRDHTELSIPAVGDPTPSTAVLYLERNGRVMLMDFLAGVTGIQNAELLKYAAEVDVAMPDGRTVPLRVLDPVHCLLSRMANLKAYASKRAGNGLLQAQWAIDILRAYLRYMVACGAPEDTMRKQCHRVAEIAEYGSKAAAFCFTRYQIDPLLTVDADVVAAGGTGFAEKDWPVTVARIRRKQSDWLKKASRER